MTETIFLLVFDLRMEGLSEHGGNDKDILFILRRNFRDKTVISCAVTMIMTMIKY